MTARRPIEIVGGGVAGLSLGVALRRLGVPVTVIEAGDYPRHRVCGEFIAGLEPSTLDRLGLAEPGDAGKFHGDAVRPSLRGLLADAEPHRRVTYHLGERTLGSFVLPTTAWGLSRHVLDARLAGAFESAGGVLRRQSRIGGDEAAPGRVNAGGRARRGPLWVGLKAHVRGFDLAKDFEVHLGAGAYVGLSRVENGAVNVCGLFSPRAVFARGADLIGAYLGEAGLGSLLERLRGAALDAESVCVRAAPLGCPRVGRWEGVRIGDACASTPPFTGNGLAMAFQGAELAAGPLEAYARGALDWAEASRAIARAQRRRFRRRLAVASWLHPFFLEPRRQRLLAALAGARLLPFNTLYGMLH